VASAGTVKKLFATSVLYVGLMLGVGLGLSAVANADVSYGYSNEIYASPDTYADPAPDLVPWGQWINEGMASAPHVDNTVQQSR